MSNEYLTLRRVASFRSCFPAGGGGGAGPCAPHTIKRLASKIAEKKDESYSDAITYIRTRISFAILRSAIKCLRGCRGSKRPTDIDSSYSAIVREGRPDS